jgi:peptidoglycan/LPS O-acetylase OafA/YrhL
MINIGFFAIGIGMKKNYIKINGINKYILLTIFFLMVIEDKIIGNLMIGWMFALAALLTLCLNFKSQSSKLNLVINFIGKRTYGIFFVHFLLSMTPASQFQKINISSRQTFRSKRRFDA